jgi:heat shock protein HslJ
MRLGGLVVPDEEEAPRNSAFSITDCMMVSATDCCNSFFASLPLTTFPSAASDEEG